jgi:HEPN domain-containing protein
MPPKPVHGDPRDWLSRAKASLALARGRALAGVLLEDLCYQTQQSAEKALKALYIHRGVAFPFVHNLDHLFLGLEAMGLEIPESVDRAVILTRYAVETRYPGTFEELTEEDYQEALRLAENVLAWVEGHL